MIDIFREKPAVGDKGWKSADKSQFQADSKIEHSEVKGGEKADEKMSSGRRRSKTKKTLQEEGATMR